MAHYVAELIIDVEKSEVKDRPEKLSKCFDAILKLWEHRYKWPQEKQPFRNIIPVFEAIKNLDPHTDSTMYFHHKEMHAEKIEQEIETNNWLELARSLDYSARILIRFCLKQASQYALDQSMFWTELAGQADLDDNDLQIIRTLKEENEIFDGIDLDENKRKVLEDRINRLEGLKTLAEKLSKDLQHQLDTVNHNQAIEK